MYIKPVRPKNVSDQVYEQLRDLIFRGKLAPGKKLPPERDLAEAFGISSPSVKTAINKLVNQGLVTQHQGRGTFVCSLETRYLDNPLRQVLEGEDVRLFDLLEVRLGLETQTVGLGPEGRMQAISGPWKPAWRKCWPRWTRGRWARRKTWPST